MTAATQDFEYGRARRWLSTAFGLALLMGASGGAAVAQRNLADKFGGFSANSNAPINIEADSLEVDDVKKIALFKGNVKAVQDDFTIRSKELEVKYSGQAGASGPTTQLTHLKARGKVLITSSKKQSATSDWAIFDVKGQTITIGGNVVLTQDRDVLRGDRLVIDLKSGKSRFLRGDRAGAKGGGRIRVLLQPRSKKKKKTPAKGAPGTKPPGGTSSSPVLRGPAAPR